MTTEIAEYSPTEAALADLRQRYGKVVFDVTTTKGMDLARKGRSEIKGYRVALEAKRVEIKAPALERCRMIDAEAKRITAEREAKEAQEREERRQQAELMDGMQMLETFVERFGKREEFKAVVKGISGWLAKQKQPA